MTKSSERHANAWEYRLMSRAKDGVQALKLYGHNDYRLTNAFHKEDYARSELKWSQNSLASREHILVRMRRVEKKEEPEELNDDLPDFLRKQPDDYAKMIADAADRAEKRGKELAETVKGRMKASDEERYKAWLVENRRQRKAMN